MLRAGPIVLRAVLAADRSVLAALRNDVELQLALLAHPKPNPPGAVDRWIDDKAQAGAFFSVAQADDDGCIGFAQLTAVDPISRHAHLGLALAASVRSRGLARHVLDALARYAADVLSLRKLCLEVRADNVPALAAYRRAGFESVGLRRGHFFALGAFHDVVLMERFLG